MHRMVSVVFKTLILSIVFLFLLDTSLILFEVVSIHSRISNLAGIMQMERARNNCMPGQLADAFELSLNDIENKSTIMDKTAGEGDTTLRDITTNLRTELSPDDAGEYGDFVVLRVHAFLHPNYVYFPTVEDRATTGTVLKDGGESNIVLQYEYRVPCLRYLK